MLNSSKLVLVASESLDKEAAAAKQGELYRQERFGKGQRNSTNYNNNNNNNNVISARSNHNQYDVEQTHEASRNGGPAASFSTAQAQERESRSRYRRCDPPQAAVKAAASPSSPGSLQRASSNLPSKEQAARKRLVEFPPLPTSSPRIDFKRTNFLQERLNGSTQSLDRTSRLPTEVKEVWESGYRSCGSKDSLGNLKFIDDTSVESDLNSLVSFDQRREPEYRRAKVFKPIKVKCLRASSPFPISVDDSPPIDVKAAKGGGKPLLVEAWRPSSPYPVPVDSPRASSPFPVSVDDDEEGGGRPQLEELLERGSTPFPISVDDEGGESEDDDDDDSLSLDLPPSRTGTIRKRKKLPAVESVLNHLDLKSRLGVRPATPDSELDKSRVFRGATSVDASAGSTSRPDSRQSSISHNLLLPERPDSSLSIQSCLLYTSPSPRDRQKSRMPSSA